MAAVVEARLQYKVTHSDMLREAGRNTGVRRIYRGADLAVQRFLRQLGHYRRQLPRRRQVQNGWLLAFRHDFRSILRQRPCVGLREFLGVCPPDHPSYAIGIWLLGRCATRQTSFDLDRLPATEDGRVRRHYARALQRVESWPRLRKIAARHPGDLFVRRMLAPASNDRFAKRLARFAEHVDHTHEAEAAVASQMPLWVRDAEWVETQPKQSSWIRMILERIRTWVRGEQRV